MVREYIEHRNKKRGIKDFNCSEELNKTLNFPGKKINVQAGNNVPQFGKTMNLNEIGPEGLNALLIKEGVTLDLAGNNIGAAGAEALAKEWKNSLQPGIIIDPDKLTDTEKEALRRYWNGGVSEEWKDSLQPGIIIDPDKLTDTEAEALGRYWEGGVLEEGFRDDSVENHTIKHDKNQEGLLNKLKNVGGDIIDMKLNGIGDDGLIQLVEQLRDKLRPGIKIILSDNNISVKGIKVFAKELKDNLQRGMEIDFGYNQIGAEGVNEMAKEWSTALKKGMILKLGQNNIGDAGAEAISKMELKEGVILDLSRNNIGDEGVDAIMKNFELKKGVTINLRFNNISWEKRKKLEERVKSYNYRGIDCSVLL